MLFDTPEYLSAKHQLIETLELLRLTVSIILFYHVVYRRFVLARMQKAIVGLIEEPLWPVHALVESAHLSGLSWDDGSQRSVHHGSVLHLNSSYI
jgi:hypothetical protein